MLTQKLLYSKLGHPQNLYKDLVIWDVPVELEKGPFPDKVYCHPILIGPLTLAFTYLYDRGLNKELKTWDGCHNFRPMRKYEVKYLELMKAGKQEKAIELLSIHSWALAIDVNAATNGLGEKPTLSKEFVKCFTDAGFDWGGNFKSRLDGMHFQLSEKTFLSDSFLKGKK